MLLSLEETAIPLKLVFQLREALQTQPERVSLTQALTLDTSKPRLGIKGVHGLFGAPQWWESIQDRRMPLLVLAGTIVRVYSVGQDARAGNNTIDLRLADGTERAVGIYVNNCQDIACFRVGCRASIVYALDELKSQPASDGGVNYSRIALEMAVSTDTVVPPGST
jgi:hypothetical protein